MRKGYTCSQIFHELVLERAKVSEDYQIKTWIKLKEAVAAIQNSRPISYCLEELYTAVENMCSYNMAPQLYENLKGKSIYLVQL